jgi:hypothetical protein
MEGAAESCIVQELAGNRLESPTLQRAHCCGMMRRLRYKIELTAISNRTKHFGMIVMLGFNQTAYM